MSNPVGGLAAQMLQLWATSFDPRYLPHYAEAYRRLLSKGIRFPAPGDGFKEQIVYRSHTSKPSSTSSTSHHTKPKSASVSSPSRSSSIPSSVVTALDSIGEFLGFVFSITEDPNAPIPEDLLKPSIKSLEEHLKKIAELVDANIGNEDAVRRLLEVNDQLDAAAKRLNGHRNIIDAEDDDSSDSDSDDVQYKRSKAKNNSKSKSAPNVAEAASTISPSKKTSKRKSRPDSVSKSSATSASTSDLMSFGAPLSPSSSSTAPAATFDAFDFSHSSSAFNFSHSSSAFAPSSGATAGWAAFDEPSKGQNTNNNAFAPHQYAPSPQMNAGFNGDANGSAFDYRMAPPTSYSQPIQPSSSGNANNSFNPFSFETAPAPASTAAAHQPAAAMPQTPAFAMFGSSSSVSSNPAPTSPQATSPPPTTHQSTQRVANTFGKYWSNPETVPAPSSPPAATHSSGPFASGSSNGMNMFASPASPTSSNNGYGSPATNYNPAPIPATSTSNNPFL